MERERSTRSLDVEVTERLGISPGAYDERGLTHMEMDRRVPPGYGRGSVPPNHEGSAPLRLRGGYAYDLDDGETEPRAGSVSAFGANEEQGNWMRGKAFTNLGQKGRQPIARVLFEQGKCQADVVNDPDCPVGRSAFSGYINGHRTPKPEVAQRFAEVLGVPVGELFVPTGGAVDRWAPWDGDAR